MKFLEKSLINLKIKTYKRETKHVNYEKLGQQRFQIKAFKVCYYHCCFKVKLYQQQDFSYGGYTGNFAMNGS